MKAKNLLVALAMILGFSFSAKAQIIDGFTVGTDVIPYFLNGYDVEVGWDFGSNRIGFTLADADVPDFLNNQSSSFNLHRSTLDLYYSRFAREDQTGLHYGLNIGYVYKEVVEEAASGIQKDNQYMRGGLRLGYFIYPAKNTTGFFRGFYIEPQINANLAFSSDLDVAFTNQEFDSSILSVSGPSLRFGFKF